MSNLFYRNPRLLILVVCLIIVAGLSSYCMLPRMEDPPLRRRVAVINTRFPGADASRVESLVTEKLEAEIREIQEIKELRSISHLGVSTITIELRADVYDVDPVWSKVRDRIEDASRQFPDGVLKPRFDKINLAYALIVSLSWTQDDEPNYALLRRFALLLEDELKSIPGTEKVDIFGAPEEEISVEIKGSKLSSLGLTVMDVSRQIRASDAKVAAGQVRGRRGNLLLQVSGELDSLVRVGKTPIRCGRGGRWVRLADIAEINKGIVDPPDSLSLIGGRPAVALAVLVRSEHRIDQWSLAVDRSLKRFEEQLPLGIELDFVFKQNRYVQKRMAELLSNLLLGSLAVVAVIFVMMGWRNALIVGSALPLSALMVLAGMQMLDVPIHQISVTGLVIALGLLIDNAIVIVDEVRERSRAGTAPAEAVSRSVRHLVVPLFGSTLTTALAFAPIALMTGPVGEFVGSVAISVILAIFSSFVLAMTIVPALAAFSNRLKRRTTAVTWW
ncbi:MAG: efflux RND transporter permease subunit, partial [Pirellulales bacterium]|nr:efflux RND transporter permease subunit [Pirellulales bacterium]